ncbi:MAG TPA: family 78 glycoside hydrolase catalytic domain [Bryobacteraceae bacterium]|nr:family 78 glycoside hydrolase catalytic domain [Bryobacteraceae bacterium]
MALRYSAPVRTCIAALVLLQVARAALVPTGLRTESQTDPLAVESAHPRLSWLLDPARPGDSAKSQSAYRILVASSSLALARNHGDLWDTGVIHSAATIQIPYAGKPLVSGAEYWWKVQVWDEKNEVSAWSAPAHWGMGLRAADWKARWIAAQPDGAAPSAGMPVFRATVRLAARPVRAIAYISGLGQYELSVNGGKTGSRVLAPGWTNYRRTVLYNAYDITEALWAGDNAIGVMLGNGFFNVAKVSGRYTKLVESFGQPKLIAQIRIATADGKTLELATGASWKTHSGPITFSHEYGGEDFDARREPAGWNAPGFDDAAWSPALEVASPGGTLTAEENPPIEKFKTFRPVRVTEPKPGVTVYDLGHNFAGIPRVTLEGEAGASVKLLAGELLTPEGLVSQVSSGGPQWYSYTLAGAKPETWSPRFSYYGFRYVQVEVTGKAVVTALDGRFVHAAAAVTGEFTCSNGLFNRIHGLIDAAILSNMQSVLTDCPHREKLGWLEQTHLSGPGIMYNYDVEKLYAKIARDIEDSQTPAGLAPDIAPEFAVFDGGFRDSPEWGSAIVLSPWLAYQHYGDRATLAARYEDMKRYVAYLGNKADAGILSYGLGDWYDIGPKPPGRSQLTGLDVTATAIYYQDLSTLSKIAGLLGKPADAAAFEAAAQSVRTAFQSRLFHPATGAYGRGSQTANAMPLALGMVPQEFRPLVLARLVDDIRAHNNHTTAGDIGFHYVLQALAEGGRSDVVYEILSNPEAPSYAAQLAAGATALTEAWDADPRSSQNHFMLGHAEEWFYRYLAGIDFDLSRPPGERIVLRPTPVGDITYAAATVHTPLGKIVSSWNLSSGKLIYDVEIPPNTQAKVILPSGTQEIRSGLHHFDSK